MGIKGMIKGIYHFFYPVFDFGKSFSMKKKIKLKDGMIHLVFICQCEHIFDKAKYFIKYINQNEEFKVSIFIVPDEVEKEHTIFEDFAIKNKIEYHKYKEGLLKELQPDLVCYTRPYEPYLPKDIRAKRVIKFAKTVYIPYGYSLMDLGNVNLGHSFTRNLSLFFADNEYAYNYFKKHNKLLLKRKAQYCFDVGYPYFEDLNVNLEDYLKSQPSLFKNKNRIKVIWTPRWTVESTLGGSNFFRYIDNLFDYLVDNNDFDFVFRPHPFAISNYVKNEMLTQEKADEYLARLNSSKNSVYDRNDLYLNSFNESDVLITDISSIIAEYMFFNKPIIFCHNEKEEICNEVFERYSPYFYHAYNFEDIKTVLSNLNKGIDPLKEDREKAFKEFKNSFQNTSERMVDNILKLKYKWYK